MEIKRSTRGPREEATYLFRILGDGCPSSLRSPLRAVMNGTERQGTTEDVLQFAIDVINILPTRS